MNVSARGLRAFRSRLASHRQRSDLVTMAHIKEQSRLGSSNHGRKRMMKELKDTRLHIGHRRVRRSSLIDCVAINCQSADAPKRHTSD
jgi:hypothetical protein|tara:strand:+ start:464 stop:727 length:264 start_codon:yes stop_codon:yes gene_type:complete